MVFVLFVFLVLNLEFIVSWFKADQNVKNSMIDRYNKDTDNCWRALARQYTILVNRGKIQILSDVRLEACAVEHYPG